MSNHPLTVMSRPAEGLPAHALSEATGGDPLTDGRRAGARDRLLAAMRTLSAADGWEPVSDASLCAAARVSDETFHRHFAGREECFAAVVEEAVDVLLDQVEAAGEGEGSWDSRVRRVLAAFYSALDTDERLAWLCVVEPMSASPWAREARTRSTQRLSRLLAPEGAAPSHMDEAVEAQWQLAYLHIARDPVSPSFAGLARMGAALVLAAGAEEQRDGQDPS